MSRILVSAIVNTRNEEENIESALRSIRNQTYKALEIIVVDNESSDRTKEISLKFTKLVFNKGPERSPQKNFGAQVSTGDWLLFVDADQVLEPEVVEQCVKFVESNPNIEAVIIPEKSTGDGFWAQVKSFEKSLYLGDETIEAPRFILKKAFFKVGGYNPELIAAEDWDLSDKLRKVGIKFGRIKTFINHNEGRISLFKTAKKKYYYGTQIRNYFTRAGKQDIQRFSLLRGAYFKNWFKFLQKPRLAVGFLVLKGIEAISGGLGFLKSLIRI